MGEHMSENAATETTTAPAQEPATAPAPKPEPDWKVEARKWESRAKENAKAAEKLSALEEAQKTEQQRSTERAEAAERRTAEVELRATRLEVAAEKGLSITQAKRLVGATREELEADADELLADLASTNQTNTPKPDLTQGGNSGGGATRTPQQEFGDFITRQLSG